MICPVCKREYPPDATECGDCNVKLVAELPQPDAPHAFLELWRGEDPAFHDELAEELDNAGIDYADTPLEVLLRNTAEPFPIGFGPKFGFVISVRSSDSSEAQAILSKLLDEEPADVEIPGIEVSELPEPPLVYVTEQNAVAEVWRGKGERISEFLIAALQENEIPMHLDISGGETGILVSAANEARAREIVREILDAQPPE